MFTQEEQYTELLEPIPKPHQVPQNDNNVISEVSSVEQSGGTVEQHPTNVEETHVLYDSLYNNLAIEVEKVITINRKLSETNAELTTELARYKNQETCFEISQEKYDKLERCYQKPVYQEQCLSKKINSLHLSFEKKKLKYDLKIREDELLDKQIQLEKKIKELDNTLVKTGQSIQTIHMLSPKPYSFYHTEQKMALGYQNPFYLKQAQQKQQSLYDGKLLFEKHDPPIVHDSEEALQLAQESKALELEIERLLRAVVSQDIMFVVQNNSVGETSNLQTELERTKERFENCIIKKENEYAKLWNDWYKQCKECKFDKSSYDKAYNDMQQKIERLQAQLGDLKGKSKDTSCVLDTLNPWSQKLKNKNVELEFQDLNYAKENAHLKTTYKNLFDSISVTRTQTKTIFDSLQNKLHDTIYENAKLRAQLFDKVSDQKDTACGTSANTKFLKQSFLGKPPKVGETHALSKPITSNSISTPQGSKVVKNVKVIAPLIFRINPFKPSREEKHVPNKVRASNVKSKVVCAMCKQCLIFVNHDECLLNYVNGMISRGKKQNENVSINEKQKKQQPKVKKTKKVGSIERLASPKPSKPRSFLRWSPTGRMFDLKGKIIASSESESQSDCSKGDNACTSNPLKLTIKRFPNSTFFFGRNDHIAAIMGFGDLQWGNILITRVYFVEGLGHNLFSEHLCPSCEQGKSKSASHPPKPVPNSRQRLHLLHMDLCGPIRIASINGKLYVLVIVDDYSRYTWVHFHGSKDEAPEVIKTFLKRITVLLQSPVIIIRTDNDTEFKNQVLKEYFDSVGISHQVSSIRTPQQNGVVEQRIVEATRTMLIFSRASLFVWAEAIATACFTQNRSIIHRRFNRTPYELINGKKLDIFFLHVFGALCYPKNDREDIGKLGAKGDIGFFIGYSADSCAFRVYNRWTKKIIETMNVSFDELSAMAFEQRSSKLGLQSITSGQITMYNDYIGGQPSSAPRIVPAAQAHQIRQTLTTSTSVADTAPTPTNSSSQATIFPNTSQDVEGLNSQQQHAQHQEYRAPIQPETVADNVPNAMFDANTFVNPFATPSTSAAESSSLQYVDPSNMHTFYQPYPHEF
uniref:Integrase, catalytic region, zinc finger, CCHC-type, peptidase aspartic, catalytic n=1 Tax=Tanacetum cinerariifolium TaxID=118510 RepID=A0A699IRD2_TANCI|nr:integrase, catalytic region, zinc finger, CCHC-type, peptidase aspartic, catalytic [Tanacetum cinerariifolium]